MRLLGFPDWPTELGLGGDPSKSCHHSTGQVLSDLVHLHGNESVCLKIRLSRSVGLIDNRIDVYALVPGPEPHIKISDLHNF